MPDRLQTVTEKLLDRVEGLLEEDDLEAQTMKHLAAILKDVRDIRKDAAPEAASEGVLVTLEGEVAGYAG